MGKSQRKSRHFNPRPPQGERRYVRNLQCHKIVISIHAPRKGSDDIGNSLYTSQSRFQSTPPARGATVLSIQVLPTLHISIHAPRKGSDIVSVADNSLESAFQSTPPARGATHQSNSCALCISHFNPRPPQGERRILDSPGEAVHSISIHPPRKGSDLIFDLRPALCDISIHAPRKGSDLALV